MPILKLVAFIFQKCTSAVILQVIFSFVIANVGIIPIAILSVINHPIEGLNVYSKVVIADG